MAEYIDKSALYEKIAQLEELARNRYLETPSSSPFCSRYMTQLNERTVFKHIIADFPSDDVAPVRRGRWERVIPSKSAAKWSTKVSCSNCHNAGYTRYKYCPNCGCLMLGGED